MVIVRQLGFNNMSVKRVLQKLQLISATGTTKIYEMFSQIFIVGKFYSTFKWKF